jgi:hypothetical protein
MTEFHPTTRQPLVPGTPQHTAFTAEQTARVVYSQLEQQRRDQENQAQYEDAPPSVAATYYPPPGAAAQPSMPQQVGRVRKPFNWRRVGWILAVLAALWALGATYDVVTGHASPVGAAVFAAVSALGAVIAFAVPRRQDRGR